MNSLVGVISADLVGSTSIPVEDKINILNELKIWFKEMNHIKKVYTKFSKGDTIEMVIPDPVNTMRMALLLKAKVKSLSPPIKYLNIPGNRKSENQKNELRFNYFKTFGIRMAIDIGHMDVIDKKKGILEGEAIYRTGRRIESGSTSENERIVIKNTISFTSINMEWQNEFEVVFGLLDFIISKATPRQCEILSYKLQGMGEAHIAEKLNIRQPAVNQFSNAIGFRPIEKAILRFENKINQ